MHFLVVSARFYTTLADAMEASAMEALRQAGVQGSVVHVPGALEIAPVIRYALENRRYDGFVALGCVMRGETYHFDVVANESARALTWLAMEHQVAIGNGILTVEDEAQARARVHKGREAAEAALVLVKLREGMGA